MNTEISLSRQYRESTIEMLYYFARYDNNQKPFADMSSKNVIMYLDSTRKPESIDLQHTLIGTFNLSKMYLLSFFKRLRSLSLPVGSCTTPEVMQNTPRLRCKQIFTVKPSNLWTEEDNALFLKYRGNK
ncbi:MAG TPA: hypothetical protein VKA98_10205 [Nitrososphaeraceae archaeon]|nr:hypothetical protein [Nitrososphaeraceae archaeon]